MERSTKIERRVARTRIDNEVAQRPLPEPPEYVRLDVDRERLSARRVLLGTGTPEAEVLHSTVAYCVDGFSISTRGRRTSPLPLGEEPVHAGRRDTALSCRPPMAGARYMPAPDDRCVAVTTGTRRRWRARRDCVDRNVSRARGATIGPLEGRSGDGAGTHRGCGAVLRGYAAGRTGEVAAVEPERTTSSTGESMPIPCARHSRRVPGIVRRQRPAVPAIRWRTPRVRGLEARDSTVRAWHRTRTATDSGPASGGCATGEAGADGEEREPVSRRRWRPLRPDSAENPRGWFRPHARRRC